MGRNFRAARVFQTVQTYTSSNRLTKDFDTKVKPAWFAAVQANPPTEILTRPYPIQHQPLDPNARKAHNMYKPTKIVYPEDELRSTFYRDHPWELARPRLILELDGKDARSRNWKYLRQPGMALSGEWYDGPTFCLFSSLGEILSANNMKTAWSNGSCG